MRVLEMIESQPWAIRPEALRELYAVATRSTGETIEAVERRLGRPLDNTRSVTMRDGVALIPVSGPIFRYANLFTEVSGATSIEVLAKDFTQALANGNVQSILFVIDSPGGQVNGVHEFAQMIYDARSDPNRKPMGAYVGGMAASAAYWIASAVDPGNIVADATATLGSIGVVAVVPDPAQTKSKSIEIVSSQSPRKRLDITTEEGKNAIQTEIDALAEVFVNDVARNRGVSVDTVINNYGMGGVMVGEAATMMLPRGLADHIGSLESMIEKMKKQQFNQMPMNGTGR